MMPVVPRDALAARHQRVRAALAAEGIDALVVTHLPNIFYLTGFRGTAGIAVLGPDRLYLVIDFRYRAAVDALLASPDGCPETTAIPVERSYDEALAALLGTRAFGRVGVEGAHLPVTRWQRLAAARGASGGRPVDTAAAAGSGAGPLVVTDGLVERIRLCKDPHEIAMLRTGAGLLSEVAPDVLQGVAPGRRERDVAADIDWKLRRVGFERPAFDTIVASGPNAGMPHARPGDRFLEPGDLVVLDFGGVYGGYCVDLTRTICLGEPGFEAGRVYAAVRAAQVAAIAASGPGVRASRVDSAARDILKGEGLGEAFGHGTGHGLGIEVHEEPRIGPAREPADPPPAVPGAPVATFPAGDQVLEPGMVFTVEPGAYIPGWGGVRIEDDVLVTGDGCEVLTRVPYGLTAG
jgi:Xaa-Pro aminopeptidase